MRWFRSSAGTASRLLGAEAPADRRNAVAPAERRDEAEPALVRCAALIGARARLRRRGGAGRVGRRGRHRAVPQLHADRGGVRAARPARAAALGCGVQDGRHDRRAGL